MRRVNKLPQNIQIRDSETMAIRGLNLTNNYTDGDLESVLNISSDHYPYFEPIRNVDDLNFTPSPPDPVVAPDARWTPCDFTYWDGHMIVICWADYIDPEIPSPGEVKRIGIFTDEKYTDETQWHHIGDNKLYVDWDIASDDEFYKGERQFAAIGGKLLILPDGVVFEKTENGYDGYRAGKTDAGPSVSLVNAVYSGKTITVGSTITITDWYGLHMGQGITISGSTVNDGYTGRITDIDETNHVITLDKDLTSGTEGGAKPVATADGIPEMDYICAKDNRIWGCVSTVENGFKKQIIYASALGNPYVFDEYSTLLGGWATEVECDDDWTGCAALPSTLLFFKERKIIRVLGNDPSEFTCYTSNVEGVKKGCWRSIVNINDTIYYLGAHGVYAYNGSVPMRLSERLGDKMYGDASAGTDGIHYYIQMAEVDINYDRQTPYTLYVYNLMQGFWTAHDTQTERMLFGQGNTLGVTYLKGGELYMTNPANDSEGIPFEMVFKPIYATITGSWNRSTQVFLKKRYLKTSIRMECGDEGTYTIYCQFDDGEWEEIGKRLPDTPTEKKSGVDIYAIPNNHCDRFRMKITGEGNVRLLGIQREYVLAGRR
jgi:hypothetical protein